MNDRHFEYWKESLGLTLEDENIEVTDDLVKAIMFIQEMEDTAAGFDDISNPLEGEIRKLEEKIINIEKLNSDYIDRLTSEKDNIIDSKNSRIDDLQEELGY